MGPLKGVRIVEMAGIGPAPFCGMLLADLGAEVIRIDRLTASDLGFDVDVKYDLLNRSKRAVAVNLKSPQGIATVLKLVRDADILLEGFRPGVMERLGLGPEQCHAVNPRLVYGRMTGWGQNGPMKSLAGHDINYIALGGALHAIGPKDGAPIPPLNLVGDFGGGSLYLAMGVLAAMHEAKNSGLGQVIDAAMVDGTASLMTMMIGYLQAGIWKNERGSNATDGAAPYYTTYQTKDGKYIAVGAIEARFYAELVKRLGLSDAGLPEQEDRARWGELRGRFADVFKTKTRDEWASIFAEGDSCVTPVLDMVECMTHPHLAERQIFVRNNGIDEPAPAPKFSRTPGAIKNPPLDPLKDTHGALQAWGFSTSELSELAAAGVIAASKK